MKRGWSKHEIEAVVDAYFDMLQAHVEGDDFVKAHHNRGILPQLDDRTVGAVEYKHCNISAVLDEHGYDHLPGYRPLTHYQKELESAVLDAVEKLDPRIHQAIEPDDPTTDLDPGSIYDYDAVSKIHPQHGGIYRKDGVARSIITDMGKDTGYRDRWIEPGAVLDYVGHEADEDEDHEWDTFNRSLRAAMEQETKVHVFERLQRGPARYRYHGRWWVLEAGETQAGDSDRTVIRFVLSKYRNWRESERVADDAAPDTTAPPPETETRVVRRIRDSAMARELKDAHDHRCQVCGETRRLDDETRYAEVHHLHPLGEGGPDTPENILIVCPDHHVDFDYGVAAVDPSDGRTVRHDFEEAVDRRELRTVEGHRVGSRFLEYHFEQIYNS